MGAYIIFRDYFFCTPAPDYKPNLGAVGCLWARCLHVRVVRTRNERFRVFPIPPSVSDYPLSVGFFSVYVLVLRFVLLSCTHSVQQTHRQNNNKTFLEHMLATLMQKVEVKLWPLISSRVVDIWKDVWSANSFTKIISSCHTRNRLSSWLPSWHEKNQHIVPLSYYIPLFTQKTFQAKEQPMPLFWKETDNRRPKNTRCVIFTYERGVWSDEDQTLYVCI